MSVRSKGHGDDYRQAVQPLVEAVGPHRYFEPRLTGGFKYGPRRAGPRVSAAQPAEWRLLAAAAGARERSGETRDTRRALAAASLVLGATDEAVVLLKEMLQTRPDDPHLLTDFSAALLVRASDPAHASDYPAALEAASRALTGRRPLPEALHNRALALEGLGLLEEARTAWMTLRQVPDGWQSEAALQIQRIETLLEARRRPPADLTIDSQVHAWARAVREGNQAEAEKAVEAANVYKTETGDSFYSTAFQAADRLGGSRRQRLLSGIDDLAEAAARANNDEWEASLVAARRAQAALEASGSQLALLAELRAGTANYYRGSLEAAGSVLSDVLERTRPDFLAVRARALWILGLVEFVREHPFQAAERHRAAAELYDKALQPGFAVFLRSLLAQDFFAQGQHDTAWRTWREVVASPAVASLSPRRRFTILWEMARRILDSEPFAALALLDRSVSIARESGDPALHAAALIRRGRSVLRTGDVARAGHDERRAAEIIHDMSPDLRERWLHDHALLAGEVERHHSASSESALEAFYRYFLSHGHRLQAIEAAEQLADLAAQRGEYEKAIARTDASLTHLRGQSTGVRDALDRSRFLERFERLHSRQVHWLIKAGRAQEAAAAALDPMRGHASRAHRHEPDVRPGHRVLLLSESEGRVAAWLYDSGISTEFDLRVSDAPLPISAKTPNVLAGLIVDSLGLKPARAGRLTIIPAGELRWLDWAAVLHELDRASPAIEVDLGLAVHQASKAGANDCRAHLTIVALDSAVSLAGVELGFLALVSKEVQGIRESQGNLATIIRGQSASVLRGLPAGGALHIAGHLVSDPMGASDALPFPDGRGGFELLHSRDVAGLGWVRPPSLVFLNVCGSATSRSKRPLNMAHAFLLAGAQEVVATTRPVMDHVALEAALTFYADWPRRTPTSLARSLRAVGESDSAPYITVSRVRLRQRQEEQ